MILGLRKIFFKYVRKSNTCKGGKWKDLITPKLKISAVLNILRVSDSCLVVSDSL